MFADVQDFTTPEFPPVEGRVVSLPAVEPMKVHDLKSAMEAREKIQDYLKQAASFAKRESVLYKAGVGSAASIAPMADIALMGVPLFSVSNALLTGHKRRKSLEGRARSKAAQACLEKLDEYLDTMKSFEKGQQSNASADTRCSVNGALVPIVSSSSILV